MTTFRARGEFVAQTEGISLRSSFYNFSGVLADLPTYPTVSIIQPSGNVVLAPTAAGVYRLSTGIYGFDYVTGINSPLGVWVDRWVGADSDGYVFTKEFNFIVDNGQSPRINSDGYYSLGDDVGFNFSQTAIYNINKVLKAVKARLNSSGMSVTTDQFGNKIHSNCDVFTNDTLITFICTSLSLFNEIPTLTNFTFDDSNIINQFFEVLVQGSVIHALSSHALLERGAEFQVTEAGVSFQPATVSELLNGQWTTEFANYYEKVKFIKVNIRPSPLGLGTLTMSSGLNPAISRLRHRKEGRYF